MWVVKDIGGPSLLWGEFLEVWEGVKGDILVNGATCGQCKSGDEERGGAYANWRHLSISRSRWRFS
jgi:hypothetical protein